MVTCHVKKSVADNIIFGGPLYQPVAEAVMLLILHDINSPLPL